MLSQKGVVTFLDLLAVLLTDTVRMLFAFTINRGYCWIMANLLSPKTTRSFSAELLPSQWVPGLYCYSLGLCACPCWISYLILQLVWVLLNGNAAPEHVNWCCFPCLVYSSDLLRVHFIFSCRSLFREIKRNRYQDRHLGKSLC